MNELQRVREEQEHRYTHDDLRYHEGEQHEEVGARWRRPAPAGYADREEHAERHRDEHGEKRQAQALDQRGAQLRTDKQRAGRVGLRVSPPPLHGEPLPHGVRSARVERDHDGYDYRQQRPRDVHPRGSGEDVRPTPGVPPPSKRRPRLLNWGRVSLLLPTTLDRAPFA